MKGGSTTKDVQSAGGTVGVQPLSKPTVAKHTDRAVELSVPVAGNKVKDSSGPTEINDSTGLALIKGTEHGSLY